MMDSMAKYLIGIMLLAGAIVALPQTAAAGEAVGLVTKVSGTVTPAVKAFEELYAGSSLELAGSNSIEFLHYPSCESITVKGGKLFLSDQNYNSRDGVIQREKRRCPRTLRLKGDARVAGVVMRSGLSVLLLAAQPSLILTGSKRKRVTGLRFLLGNQLLLAARVEGPRYEWPKDKAALAAGNRYHLEVVALHTVLRKIPFKIDKEKRTPIVIIAID
jgi:hypothetical protein